MSLFASRLIIHNVRRNFSEFVSKITFFVCCRDLCLPTWKVGTPRRRRKINRQASPPVYWFWQLKQNHSEPDELERWVPETWRRYSLRHGFWMCRKQKTWRKVAKVFWCSMLVRQRMRWFKRFGEDLLLTAMQGKCCSKSALRWTIKQVNKLIRFLTGHHLLWGFDYTANTNDPLIIELHR